MKLNIKNLLMLLDFALPVKGDILEREFDDTEIGEAFGVGLKAMRKYKKITLVELSKEIDIPNPSLSRYENGLNIPTITQAIKIANYFNMNVELIILLGIGGIYENANMEQIYENLQNAFAQAKKNAILNRAKKKK